MTPEAGAKYILSNERIDSIIVIGGGASFDKGDELRPLPLSNSMDWEIDINKMSDYSFFRYRLSQYRDDVDLEGLDVLENIEPERKEFLLKVYDDTKKYLRKKFKDYRKGMEFHYLSQKKTANEFFMNYASDIDSKDIIWLKRLAFSQMKQEKKLKMLDVNRNLTVSFIPSINGSKEKIGDVSSIIKAMNVDGAEHINLYMDMQGAGSADGYTIISMMSMIDTERDKGLDVKEIITTHYNPADFANPIDNNEKERYELSKLVSGVSAFINYGKVDSIREYWESTGLQNDYVEKMLTGMTYIDAGVSLCHIDSLKRGVSLLRDAYETSGEYDTTTTEGILSALLEKTIRADYGKLLDSEDISMLGLAKWSFRKHFYQQTLTIIEARVPDEIVSSGLFYYAKDEESRQATLETLQVCYENTNPLQRWSFNDIDHYFLKYFKRFALEHIRGDQKSPAFINMRMDQLTKDPEENYGCSRAFSLLDDKPELLRELLAAYEEMGPLRNKLNHSDPTMEADDANEKYQVGVQEYLKTRVSNFLRIYEKAMDAAEERKAKDGDPNVILITGPEFREYSIEASRNAKYNNHGGNNHGNNGYKGNNNGNKNGYHGNNNSNNNYNGGYKGGYKKNNGYKGGYNKNYDNNNNGNVSEATVQTPAGEIHIHIHLDGLK